MIKIFAISDSHQETRKTSAFLSEILKDKNAKDSLFLNCGDIFKGIYPKDLERNSYLKTKAKNPNLQMFLTIGNNDFGFSAQSVEYFIETVKLFKKQGIFTVCANIFERKNGKILRPCWLESYKTINLENKRIFITGFCIDNLNTSKFGIIAKKQEDAFEEIYRAISFEKPDGIIILNHDYLNSSRKIAQNFIKQGIKPSLIIGGHDHEKVEADEKLKIFYPEAFCDSMYKFDFISDCDDCEIVNYQLIRQENLTKDSILPIFEEDLKKYEEKTQLYSPIVPFVLDLKKQYSNPCSLGSFLADSMKNTAGAEIAFFSTGFLMKSLEYKENEQITNYLFKKTITAQTPIQTVELNAQDIREIFSHALKTRGYQKSNPRFLQCSNNIKIKGKNNPEKQEFEILQIFVDNKALFDENLNPKNPQKKYKTAIDSFIAAGGQGFKVFENKEKFFVYKNDENSFIKINEVLLESLKQAPEKFKKGEKYPCFELIED